LQRSFSVPHSQRQTTQDVGAAPLGIVPVQLPESQ
jgi:hypothetical protein